MMRRLPMAVLLLALPGMAAAQGRTAFHAGPVFTDFAPIATIRSDVTVPAGTRFKVAFDVSDAAAPGDLSRAIETAARFINQHVDAGVLLSAISVAVVVHGAAPDDLLQSAAYADRHAGKANGSANAIAQMIGKGVVFHLCGQSAASRGITDNELLPGVKMSISAMSSHALLQRSGYTLNPF
ncbi:DsrE family protein [Sandarakinorhabdus sp. DWP1-3-1]|uniref:DsrE family protein n=1 Tax=Sandarakinorhabdus sp. DWP1-3-1 TaxID=2804627 RepID=UPI003CF6F2BF